jgi:hypothetical protein
MKYVLSASVIILLLGGCTASQAPVYRPVPVKPKPQPKPEVSVSPNKPANTHQLEEVQDTNFNPEYMYPKTPKKSHKEPTKQSDAAPVVSSSTMNKEACIAMIGQEKFDKYTQMLGGEAGAIKRCSMLKTMK